MKTQKHYAMLFWRYKRLLPYRKKHKKFDLLQHPNIAWTADGGAPPYVHGQAPKAMDPGSLFLAGETGDYEVYSEAELQEIYELEDNAS